MVLEWEIAGTERPDARVHPLSVCVEGASGGGGGVESGPEGIGPVGEAELAHLAIEGKGGPADPFGEGPFGRSGLEVELEEAIAGVQPAECAPGVEVGGREEVWNAALVDQSFDRKGEGGDGGDLFTGRIGIPGHTPDPGPGVEEGSDGREGSQSGAAQGQEGDCGEGPEQGKGTAHREWWGERGVRATAEHCRNRKIQVQLLAHIGTR